MYEPPVDVLDPGILRDAEILSGPSIASSTLAAPERLVMAVRATDAVGGSRIWLLSSRDGVAWVPRGILPDLVAADTLGEPAIFEHDGAFQLYLPYRRGTRWSIAQLASPNLADWRLVDSAALEGAGPLERLGVRDPDVRIAGDAIELVYLAVDGITERLRRTTRRATSAASFITSRR